MLRILVLVLTLTITCHASAAEPPKDFTNMIGMKFKLIPAGEFMMGSRESAEKLAAAYDLEPFVISKEHPQHRVRITKPYYLGVTEVTQGQWEEMMDTRPWEAGQRTKSGLEYAVSHVSWEDAVEFCDKLSEKEGREYRLPTEAEWEYACRAGSGATFCFRYSEVDLGFYAWHVERSWEPGAYDEVYAHPVGLKQANAWDLHDMHGNVCEWCQDWHDEDYYGDSPTEDPTGPSTGTNRVDRGGCWYGSAMFCRSAFRNSSAPDKQSSYRGFRVALDPAE